MGILAGTKKRVEDNWPAKRESEPDEIYNQSQQIRGLEARRYEYVVLNFASFFVLQQ